MSPCRWHLTVAAVREYMAISGIGDGDRAAEEIAALANDARLTQQRTGSGAQIWRTRGSVLLRGRRTRLEFTVVAHQHDRPARPDEERPLLVRVRSKGE